MPFVPPPPEAVAAQTRTESAIVREVNRVRRANGVGPVHISTRLAALAARHSADMLRHDALSHDSFDGSSFTGRLSRAGRHRKYGETLAWAPSGSRAGAHTIVTMWMASAPHRQVLLNRQLRQVGVGSVFGSLGAQRGNAITADFTS